MQPEKVIELKQLLHKTVIIFMLKNFKKKIKTRFRILDVPDANT